MSRSERSPDGVYCCIGKSGSGKSHANQTSVVQHVLDGRPVAYLDRLHELEEAPYGLHPSKCIILDSTADLASAHSQRFLGAVGLFIIPGPADIASVEQACMWAQRCEGGVAIPEAHRVYPNNGRELVKVSPAFEACLSAWRHHRVAVWLDSQRISKLHTDVTELATDLRVFATSGRNEKKALREIGDDDDGDIVGLVTEAERRRVKGKRLKDAGDPSWADHVGWHVHVTEPPYELRRL